MSSEENTSLIAARRRLIKIWTWVGAILLAGVAVYLAGILSTAIGVIIWTAVFVFMLMGPVDFLECHGVGRSLGAALSYVLLIAVIGLILFVIFSPSIGIGAQFKDLSDKLPEYTDAFSAWANGMYAQYSDVLHSDQVRQWVSDASEAVGSWIRGFASTGASGLVAAGSALVNILMCIGFALVIAFWMLVDLPKLRREAGRLVSDEHKVDAELLSITVTRVMGGYLKATIIQCLIIGVGCGILFAVLGVPSSAALGTITGLLNIIPIVGPWLGGGLAFVVCVITSPVVGVIALIGTIAIQQIIYTFVSPKLMGSSVDIHPALTFIALMAGSGVGTAMGGLVGALVGALLSIPLVAVLKSVFVYYFEKRTGRRIVSEDGVFFKGVAASEDGEVDPMADATAPAPAAQQPDATGKIPLLADLSGKLPKIDADEEEPK